MSISAEEKNRYLRETAIVLAREGFHTDRTHIGRLRVLLDGAPLCEVTENGGITYRNEDIDEPERLDAKDMVYEIVRNTAEYMRQLETAPFLKADGLEDGYKVLADFNGTVLAGVQSKHGVHFVTWDWTYGHTGVCHGHYFMENYGRTERFNCGQQAGGSFLEGRTTASFTFDTTILRIAALMHTRSISNVFRSYLQRWSRLSNRKPMSTCYFIRFLTRCCLLLQECLAVKCRMMMRPHSGHLNRYTALLYLTFVKSF